MQPFVGMQIDFAGPAKSRDDDAPRGGNGSQVLPVADLPDDFEGDPDDGEQYLFLVRREASTHPPVSRAENPYAVEHDDEHVERQPTPDAPGDRPAEAWRAAFVKQFDALRARMRATPAESTFPTPSYGELPLARDESGWKVFIQGRRLKRPAVPELTLAEAKLVALAALELDEPPAPPPPAASEETFDPAHEPHHPTPALLAALDQPTKILLLSHLSDWLTERTHAHANHVAFVPSTIFAPPALRRKGKLPPPATPCPTSTAKPTTKRPPLPTLHESHWILSLLACLDSLLSGDDISILRTLVKSVLEMVDSVGSRPSGDGVKRSREDEDEAEQVAMCWMAVAAVAATWGQGDLWNSNLW